LPESGGGEISRGKENVIDGVFLRGEEGREIVTISSMEGREQRKGGRKSFTSFN